MKVAIVHDYLNEFGGAERVLAALSEIWPKAPIYTAFYKKGSPAYGRFKAKDIRVSWAHYIPIFSSVLHSPLRFLAPLIWNSFDFSKYDLIISSASWYITKGFERKGRAVEICYCHTPPRWLYGFETATQWQKYKLVKIYGTIVAHFMRIYDFEAAQRVNYFIANSQNVARRIEKFYRRDSKVIYPPVELFENGQNYKKGNYYLIVSRLTGGKGIELAIEAFRRLGLKLKIAGVARKKNRFSDKNLLKNAPNIEFLGQISDRDLYKLYKEAKGFLALSKDEDFGITPVEAMLSGTPVIAFKGGGYLETVIEGRTGTFFSEHTPESLIEAIKRFENIEFVESKIRSHAEKFSKERFIKEITSFVNSKIRS